MGIRQLGFVFLISSLAFFPTALLADKLVAAEPAQLQATDIYHDPQSANIFAYPEHFFAVQVIAVRSKPQILDILSRYNLGDPPYGLVKTSSGLWYVLLSGVFPSYEKAVQARDGLPQDLLKFKPWIRKVGPLQAAIKAAYPVSP